MTPLRLTILNDSNASSFDPTTLIWKAWWWWCTLLLKEKTKMIQRRPNLYIFLHCPVDCYLWNKLFRTFNLSWAFPTSYHSLLLENIPSLHGLEENLPIRLWLILPGSFMQFEIPTPRFCGHLVPSTLLIADIMLMHLS